jgi:hypothetical protein
VKFKQTAIFGLIIGFLFFSTPFASAHAELVSAKPASGEILKKLPLKIVLEFDENLLVINEHNTNLLIVKDRFGTEVDEGNSTLKGRTLSVDMVPTEEFGDFSVTWRVVSDDGHPVQGSYNFSVEIPQGATAKGLPLTSLIHESVPKFDAEKTKKTGSESSFTNRTPLFLIILALIAVGIWAKFDFARRRKARIENQEK